MTKINTYAVSVNDYGDIFWHLNDQFHKKDGPAIEFANGDKFWYLNGQLHREDGPAVIRDDCRRVEWWINGYRLHEKEFNSRTKKVKEMTVEEISQELDMKLRLLNKI